MEVEGFFTLRCNFSEMFPLKMDRQSITVTGNATESLLVYLRKKRWWRRPVNELASYVSSVVAVDSILHMLSLVPWQNVDLGR